MREIECYYKDADVCSDETWECQTCHETFCTNHGHVTSKGTNVECVACEHQRKEKANENSQFHRYNPTEYAAMWGCDSSYDHFPNEKGDGAQFYNYSSYCPRSQFALKGVTHEDRVAFYKRFIPAIERTIKNVEMKPESFQPCDAGDLRKLLEHVQRELAGIEAEAPATTE